MESTTAKCVFCGKQDPSNLYIKIGTSYFFCQQCIKNSQEPTKSKLELLAEKFSKQINRVEGLIYDFSDIENALKMGFVEGFKKAQRVAKTYSVAGCADCKIINEGLKDFAGDK